MFTQYGYLALKKYDTNTITKGQCTYGCLCKFSTATICCFTLYVKTRPHLHDRTTMQDPADAANDNEQDKGNILNAMLRFPLEFTFHVVGRTGGDSNLQNEFVEQVKTIAKTTTSADEVVCKITPRGSKFTKVTLQVQVESADAINSIYDQLGELELSVMHF